MSNENIPKFKHIIQEGIDLRESILMPRNQLFKISQSILDEEVTRQEQALLKCILAQFLKMFPEGA